MLQLGWKVQRQRTTLTDQDDNRLDGVSLKAAWWVMTSDGVSAINQGHCIMGYCYMYDPWK